MPETLTVQGKAVDISTRKVAGRDGQPPAVEVTATCGTCSHTGRLTLHSERDATPFTSKEDVQAELDKFKQRIAELATHHSNLCDWIDELVKDELPVFTLPSV